MTNPQQAPATTRTVIIYRHPKGGTGRTTICHAAHLDRREQAVGWALGRNAGRPRWDHVTVTHALAASLGRSS